MEDRATHDPSVFSLKLGGLLPALAAITVGSRVTDVARSIDRLGAFAAVSVVADVLNSIEAC